MAWTADYKAQRTFDPESGAELFFLMGGSDGTSVLEIRQGDLSVVKFTVSTSDCAITSEERSALGVADALVWFVPRGDKIATDLQKLIHDALVATQFGHGSNLGDYPVFVRFGRGELFDGRVAP